MVRRTIQQLETNNKDVSKKSEIVQGKRRSRWELEGLSTARTLLQKLKFHSPTSVLIREEL
jgi:hypothetical protein